MARQLFELQAARRRNGDLANGAVYVVYSDLAGTTPADISASVDGASISGSVVTTTDVPGLGPGSARFYGPSSGVDTVYLRSAVDATLGVQKLVAADDPRLDVLEGQWLNVRAFGAVGDNLTDDTAAFEAAAAAALDTSLGKYAGVYVPRGIYRIHEVDLPSQLHLFSDNGLATRLVYNGAGGAGSYLLKWPSASYGGFEGFILAGADATLPNVAEHLVVVNGTMDNQFVWRNLGFQWCTGDAISLQVTVFANFHMERSRFDGVGGYAIGLTGNASNENRPLTLSECTYDNNISSGAIKTLMGYDGTSWGRGLVHADNGNGIVVVIENARIECNVRLLGGVDAALVYEDGATTGAINVHLDNVYGYGPLARRIPVLSTAALARGRVHVTNCSVALAGLLYDRATGKLHGQSAISHLVGGAGGNKQFALGVTVGQVPVQVDGVSISDLATSFQRYQRGDWLLYPTGDVAPGTRGFARVMAYPSTGWAVPVGAGEVISTTAAVDALGTSVTGVAYTKELREGNVSIAGAGTAGAAHLCRVTAYDPDTSTATITPAAVTTVTGATMTFQAPVWRDVGGNHAAAAPVSGDWTRGEFVWNTTPIGVSSPVADHVILGWQCVTSGTPGTWVEVRALTESLSVGGSTPTDVQVFTSSGTWTKPTDALAVEVVLVGGGAGGGSGRRGAAGTVRTGGAGGAGAGVTRQLLPASACGATEAVSVGTGGAGGAAIGADDTDGAVGTSGVASLFGSLLRATHGVFGGAGGVGAATGGTAGLGMFSGGAGQSSNATGGAGTGASAAAAGAGGGGSGGGITSGDAASNGGVGAALPNSQANQTGGGTAGTAGGAGGAGTSVVANTGSAGAGGGGGASSITGAAGAGGIGGSYGGGGGGGGASLNGNASGAGGDGAPGIAIITSFF